MNNGVGYLQNKTTLATDIYRRSPAIWNRCPLSFLRKHYPESIVEWTPEQMSLVGTQTTEIAGPIAGTKVFSTTALLVDNVSAVNSVEKWGAAIRFGSDTDNDSSSLAQAYPSMRLSGLGGSTDSCLWFEACVAVSSLLTDTLGFFVGLAETELWTLATGVPFNAASATITNGASAIGFLKGEDALGVVDTVVSDRATSWTNIGDDEGLISAANTFVKLGMLYIPAGGYLNAEYNSNRVLRFFQNNIELTTAVSKTTLTGYTNLDANAVGPIMATITDSGGTAVKAYLKWLRCAQLPPGVIPHE